MNIMRSTARPTARSLVGAHRSAAVTAASTAPVIARRPTLVAPTSPVAATLAQSPAPCTRAFSQSTRACRASVENDPKWKNGDKVTYSELKPLTDNPDDVSPPSSTDDEYMNVTDSSSSRPVMPAAEDSPDRYVRPRSPPLAPGIHSSPLTLVRIPRRCP